MPWGKNGVTLCGVWGSNSAPDGPHFYPFHLINVLFDKSRLMMYKTFGLPGIKPQTTKRSSKCPDLPKSSHSLAGRGRNVGSVHVQHKRSLQESLIFKSFFELSSENESAVDFHMRVWCLKTKCNVSEQFRSLHWGTSWLQYLLFICWQKKVSCFNPYSSVYCMISSLHTFTLS